MSAVKTPAVRAVSAPSDAFSRDGDLTLSLNLSLNEVYMVRIFADKNGSGDYVVQTTASDAETFVSELAEALTTAVMSQNDGGELAAFGILKNAMPIAFKLAGYKADTVSEQRTLVCGTVAPTACEVIASAGR